MNGTAEAVPYPKPIYETRSSNAGDASLDEAVEDCYVEVPIGVNIGRAGTHDINDPDYHEQIPAVTLSAPGLALFEALDCFQSLQFCPTLCH